MQNSGRWLHGQDSKGGECGLMSNFKTLLLDNKFIERHNIMPHNLHVTYMFFNNLQIF